MFQWQIKTFDALTNQELYDLLALRQDVFNIEQNCTEPDIDHRDNKAIHFMAYQEGEIVSYLRLFLPGTRYPHCCSFGRVVTTQKARGQGLGKAGIQQVFSFLKEHGIKAPITISAQAYLQAFYESFGFIVSSEPFDEAGILHIEMRCETYDL